MSIIEPGSSTSGLVARVKGILLRTDAEWELIDAEPATIKGIYTSYAAPLAAIPPLAGAIGLSLIGIGAFGVTVHTPLIPSLIGALVHWALALVGLYVAALVIDALAPTFGGQRSKIQAFKVAAYSSTAAWVAGALMILPMLIPLAGLLSLFGLFLIYKGLPRLMKAPQDKAFGYIAATMVVMIVVYIVVGAVTKQVGTAMAFGSAGAFARNDSTIGGKVTVGGSEIDLSQLQASAKQMEAAAKQMEAQSNGQPVKGAIQPVPAETLQGLLPAAVAGMARTEVESNSGGAGGIQGSNAQGVYTKDDARITLSVTDMGAAGGLAGLAGAFNVNSNKQTTNGYEKMGKVDGRMTTEQYDRQNQSGQFGVMVANRFMVQAQGSQVSIDALKAAVASVGLNRLEGLAKG